MVSLTRVVMSSWQVKKITVFFMSLAGFPLDHSCSSCRQTQPPVPTLLLSLKLFTTVDRNCHGKRTNLTAKRKRLAAKRITSRQKEQPRGKKNDLDLTAKEIRIKMSSRHQRNVALSLFLFAVRLFFLP